MLLLLLHLLSDTFTNGVDKGQDSESLKGPLFFWQCFSQFIAKKGNHDEEKEKRRKLLLLEVQKMFPQLVDFH